MQKKSLQTILYSTAGIVVMLVILIAFNFIAGAARTRVDLTQEKAYTLSAGTRAILKKLDTPVTIRLYCTQSESATPETVFLKGYARKVEDLVAEYRQVAGGKLKVEKYDPQPDSDAEDSARLDGIEAQPLPGADRFYLGLAVKCADQVQSIPFLAPNRERLLEYDLARAIVRAANPEKPTIGLMSPLPVFGMPSNPMMQQMGQQGSQPWAIVNELKNDFTVQRVGMDVDKIDEEIKLLVVVAPKDISEKAQYAIDQFILRGGKLIAFLDAQCLADNRQQNQMMANMGGGGSSLDKLLKAWGIQFDTGKVVADLKFKMQLRGRAGEPQEAPAWLGLTADAINKDDVATSQIDNIWMPLSGAFTGTPVAGLKETVLLQSSKDSQLVDAMLANLSGESIMKEFKPSGVNYNLAIRLTGKFKTAFPDGAPAEKKDDAEKKDEKPAEEKKADDSLKETKGDNTVVLFGDADMLYDPFTMRRIDSPFGALQMAMNANLNLAQNIVEQMTGDNNLIAVRSRATMNRPFTRVKEMEAAANVKFQSEIKRLEDSAAEAQRKINDLQAQKKDKDQRFILSPEQRTELEKLRKEEAESRKRLKQVQKDLRKEVVSLQTRLKWVNILAIPLAVTATGIVIAIVNRRKTSAK
ncbi:MAG TPA: Gldg family protein [Candidatus Paceibacterota bacterium]|nr:Gldg family protein [Verrucomicrobiota bacterium]HSA10309.1 Gldg family protein [Candidatus Paceibacterota bacterium]